jgi:predicted DNA-binding ArsR family transcriptional regulator
LFKIKVSRHPFATEEVDSIYAKVQEKLNIASDAVPYFVYQDKLTNSAYNDGTQSINLLMKNGETIEVSKASDNLNISALADPVEKHFLCYTVFNAGKARQLSLLKGMQ